MRRGVSLFKRFSNVHGFTQRRFYVLSQDIAPIAPEELKEPEMPENCCGNQCVNCVWNDYFVGMLNLQNITNL